MTERVNGPEVTAQHVSSRRLVSYMLLADHNLVQIGGQIPDVFIRLYRSEI
jgi:hypothetical protein